MGTFYRPDERERVRRMAKRVRRNGQDIYPVVILVVDGLTVDAIPLIVEASSRDEAHGKAARIAGLLDLEGGDRKVLGVRAGMSEVINPDAR